MNGNKYRTFQREEQLDKELEELENENREPEEVQTQKVETPEEASFKKRYGDLRAHSMKLENEWKAREAEYQRQLAEATKKQIAFPSTREEVQEWMERYPDVSRIVKTIAMEAAEGTKNELNKEIDELRKKKAKDERDAAYAELLTYHPDFESYRDTDEFQDWVNAQPRYIYSALYENETDVLAAKRALDLYRQDSKPIKKNTDKDTQKENARSVSTKVSSNPGNDKITWTESKVKGLSRRDYEKFEDEIDAAMADPSFYDLTGGAR